MTDATEVASPFPRPESVQDILSLKTDGLSQKQLFELLQTATPMERPDGRTSSLRLATSGSWVFKTKSSRILRDPLTVLEVLPRLRSVYGHMKYMHPAKQWFVVHDGFECWLCNVSPILVPWRALSFRRRWVARLARAWMMIHCMVNYQLYIDPNPDNYALAESGLRTYYIDDEFYTRRGKKILQVVPNTLIDPGYVDKLTADRRRVVLSALARCSRF